MSITNDQRWNLIVANYQKVIEENHTTTSLLTAFDMNGERAHFYEAQMLVEDHSDVFANAYAWIENNRYHLHAAFNDSENTFGFIAYDPTSDTVDDGKGKNLEGEHNLRLANWWMENLTIVDRRRLWLSIIMFNWCYEVSFSVTLPMVSMFAWLTRHLHDDTLLSMLSNQTTFRYLEETTWIGATNNT